MRPLGWVALVLLIIAGVWSWLPSRLVERRIAETMRVHLRPDGAVRVRARATLTGLLARQVRWAEFDVGGAHLGAVTARRISGVVRGVRLPGTESGGAQPMAVDSGTVEAEFTASDLEAFLKAHNVDAPAVTIDASGLTVSGTARMGPVTAQVRVKGTLYVVASTDLYLRITTLDVSGMEVPPALATAALGLAAAPLLSFRSLPVPVAIERVDMQPGRVIVRAVADGGRR